MQTDKDIARSLRRTKGARHAKQGYVEIVSRDRARAQPRVGQTVTFAWLGGDEPLLDDRVDELVGYREDGDQRRALMRVIASESFRLDDNATQVFDDEEMGWQAHLQPATADK